MKKILISGYYGFSNYGDDLFVASLNHLLEQGSSKVTVISACPPLYGVDSRWTVVSKLLSKYYGCLNGLGSIIRSVTIVPYVIQSDVVIHGGGSLFERDKLGVKKLIRFFLSHKSKEMCIGVSVSERALKKPTIYAYLNEMSLIVVRDKDSQNNLLRAGFSAEKVLCTGDLATPFIHHTFLNNFKKRSGLGVSLCECGDYTKQQLFELVETIANYAISTNRILKIMLLNPADRGISESLYRYASSKGVDSQIIQSNSVDFIDQIASCEAFISMRMHGAITAYILSIPFALIEYEEKCTSFLHDINYSDAQRIVDPFSRDSYRYLMDESYRPPALIPDDYVRNVKTIVLKALSSVIR